MYIFTCVPLYMSYDRIVKCMNSKYLNDIIMFINIDS